MTNRRPPPPRGFERHHAETFAQRPNVESTALLEAPMFSDAFGAISSDEQPTEQTDAERSVMVPADAATARYRVDEINNLDDIVDDLPDAHISDFDVSDLDGDVVDLAATTIMQLPPSMIGHHQPEPVIAVRKWSAGPQATSPHAVDDAASETWDGGDNDGDDEVDVPLADPPAHTRRAALAPTMPFLSVSALKAGGFLVDAPAPLAEPVQAPARNTQALVPEPGLRDLLDTTLAALLAAQACADANGVPQGLNDHLDKAVDLLSRAIDLVEDD